MGTRRWYVVHTKNHKEELVLAQLRERKIPAYRPLLQAPGRRGSRVVSLFPNYIFVHIGSVEESLAVRYAPGVRRLLSDGDRPCPVDDEIVALIRAREGEGGVIRPSRLFHFSSGDRVRISSGVLAGLEALFQRYLPSRDRVRVLLRLLGREVSIEVPADAVLPARD